MIQITYIVIKLIELFIFFVVGKDISKLKDDKSYWKTALPAIITFALVDGLRYMRMTDYEGNLWRYELTNADFYQNSDILFSTAMYFCKITDIGFTGFMIIQAAFLIFALFVLLKRYKECAMYALPILLPIIYMNENFTRWFAAISFIIIGYTYLIDKKYIKASIFMLCAALTHYAIILVFPFLILHSFFNKKTISPYISVPIFIIISLFGNISTFTIIPTIANLILDIGLISPSSSLATHLRMTEALIAGEYLKMGIVQTSMLGKFIDLIKYIPIMFFGAKIATEKNAVSFYNFVIIGLLLTPIFSQVELLGRYSSFLTMFIYIIAALYFNDAFKKKGIEYIIAIISLFLFIYPQISLTLFRGREDQMMFIWDSIENFIP